MGPSFATSFSKQRTSANVFHKNVCFSSNFATIYGSRPSALDALLMTNGSMANNESSASSALASELRGQAAQAAQAALSAECLDDLHSMARTGTNELQSCKATRATKRPTGRKHRPEISYHRASAPNATADQPQTSSRIFFIKRPPRTSQPTNHKHHPIFFTKRPPPLPPNRNVECERWRVSKPPANQNNPALKTNLFNIV